MKVPKLNSGSDRVRATLDMDAGEVLQGSGSGFRVQGSGFRIQGVGFRVQGPGSRVQGSGSRVWGSGFRVQGSGSDRVRASLDIDAGEARFHLPECIYRLVLESQLPHQIVNLLFTFVSQFTHKIVNLLHIQIKSQQQVDDFVGEVTF